MKISRQDALRMMRDYTGNPDMKIELAADPRFDDVWGIRDDDGNDYVIYSDGEIQEVRFGQWPPRNMTWL